MSTFKLGAPRVISENIRDLSGRVVTQPTAMEPTHVPVIFLLTAKQHEEPIFMYPSQIEQLLGGETIERGGKYFSHQTQLLEIIAANANPFLCYPVVVPGAKRAFLRLSVVVTDFIGTATPVPMEGSNGSVDAVRRYHVSWMSGVDAYPESTKGFGEAEAFAINPETHVYPVLEMELECAGDYGNSYGIQIKQMTMEQAPHGITKTTAMPYTLSVVERTKSGSTRIVKTVFGEDIIPFTMDSEATDRLGRPLYLPLNFDSNYAITTGATVQNFGEFEDFKIYTNDLDTVLALLYAEEQQYDTLIPNDLKNKWSLAGNPSNALLLNIFTGKMFDGVTSYRSFTVDKSLIMGAGNFAFAKYGDSGITQRSSAQNRFNEANGLVDAFVFDLNEVVTSEFSDLHNHDRWDYSIVYDTGFAPQAKTTLINLLSARSDITVLLTPMSYGELEVVPEVAPLVHDGYMRGVNNFLPIPFARSTDGPLGRVEVKGLITNLLPDRVIDSFNLFIDNVLVADMTDFVIDEDGYWTATVHPGEFGIGSYTGLMHFEAEISVDQHPEYPIQTVVSTKMEYNIVPAALPVPVITSVWGGTAVPYTSAAGEYQGLLGALVANISSADGTVNDLFDVLGAKFLFGNAKELDITNQFVTWTEVYGTPLRANLISGYNRNLTAKLQLRVRDRASLQVRTVESVPFNYSVAFPNLNPVLTVTEINNGNPIIPSYAELNVPTVKVKGTITGLGVDGLLVLQNTAVRVAGNTVSGANVQFTLALGGESAVFEANVQRGYFPVLLSNDQNINVTAPAPGVIGESYHALADVEVTANYRQLHLNNAILPVLDEVEVYVSDMISMTSAWDMIVDYNDPIPELVDPNDGINLVSSIPTVAGIENVNLGLNGSFFDYQQIVNAKATMGGEDYDIKVLNNYTVAAARIIAEKFWPNYIKSGNIALELTVKHRSGHNVKLNLNQPYTVRYPTLATVTTTVTSINGDDKVWFDEAFNDANKTVLVTGNVTGLHTLRRQKNIQLAVDNIIREDVAVTVNKTAGTWSANLPVKYMNLVNGGQTQLNLVLTYIPENQDIVAQTTARSYTVKKVTVPTFAIDSVNSGVAVTWEDSQTPGHTTEVVVGGYVAGSPVPIDPVQFTQAANELTLNGTVVPNADITWIRRVIGGVEKVVAILPTSNFTFQDHPFASDGTASAKITLTSNHNARPYAITAPTVQYAIEPKLGVVAVAVESYNNGLEVDPLNNTTAVYTLRGEVSGLAPYQTVDTMQFMFQDNVVVPNTFSLGTPVTDEGGFVTRPYTATFLGTNHLTGLVTANLTGYPDDVSTGGLIANPTSLQGAYSFTPISPTGWNVVTDLGDNVFAYSGVISAVATIRDSTTNAISDVGNYSDLTYTVTPKLAMSTKLGDWANRFLDPGTDVLANQVRKVLDFEFSLVRSDYEEVVGFDVIVGSQTVAVNDIQWHRRDINIGMGEGSYQNHLVELSIPNKYIVDNGEYLEMSIPAYMNGEEAVGLWKTGVAIRTRIRNKITNVERLYSTTTTLFSRAYFSVRAIAEVLNVNGGNPINRWADPATRIPVQFRVRDLYKRAMGQVPTEYNFTVDGRVLNDVAIVDTSYTNAPFYNSLSTMTANATVALSDLVELMNVWADSGRVAPFNGTLGVAPKVTAENGTVTQLTRATRVFTAVEILPPSTSTMDLESINGGATVILNSVSIYPVEVKAVVHALHPVWGETVNPEEVTFGINGQTVPRSDYLITVTNGTVDSQGQMDGLISIKATRQVFARYFTDEFLPIDEDALEAGVPVTGTVYVNAPVSSNYGLRATLTENKTFLAGNAVEGPSDDVTVASVNDQYQVTTATDGYRIVDLTTGEVLAEGATIADLRANALATGKVDIEMLGFLDGV